MNSKYIISPWSKRQLNDQGYCELSDPELRQHRFGFRLAYAFCGGLVILGVILKNQAILLLALGTAILGMLPPYHPVDYLYNYGIRFLIGRPKLPHRPPQGRFACFMGTSMLILITYFFYKGNFTLVYIVSAAMLTSTSLVSFIDFCIPSKIYNALFRKRTRAGKASERQIESEFSGII